MYEYMGEITKFWVYVAIVMSRKVTVLLITVIRM
jgi:hypothetical protein